jgi:4-aminobutyrate aminotransferase
MTAAILEHPSKTPPASLQPAIHGALPGPKAKQMLLRDQQVLSTSYVRPYPLVPAYGDGVWLYDVDGNRFLDMMAGIAVNTTGYNNPQVVAAVTKQAAEFSHVCFSDFTHEPLLSLAERLVAKLGGDYRVFFGNSGTEGLEAALKLVRYNTKRPYSVAFTGAFHGRSTGSLSLTASNSKYRKGFGPFIGGTIHIPYPNPYRPVFGSTPETVGEAVLDHLKHLFRTTTAPEEVGAIYFEPIQGEGGYIVPPKGFLSALAELAKQYGILLVADEVQSGVGRTGSFFAFEAENIQPDIVVLAKGLASGYPISATLFRSQLSTWGPGMHGSTFGGNAVAGAAAMATLDLVERCLQHNASDVGGYLMQRLQALQAHYPRLGEVRGRGLMIGLDFVTDPHSREENPVLRDAVQQAAFEHGVLTLSAGPSTLRLAPPLILTHQQADVAVGVLETVFKQLGV